MPELDFRFATTDDVGVIVALVESAYRGESSERGWTSESHLLGGQRIDAAMVEDLLAQPGADVVLAYRDGTLVACCELKAAWRVPEDPHPAEPDPGIVDTPEIVGGITDLAAYFGMFAVDPILQGDGIGKLVLAEAERIATEWGANRLEMTVIEQRDTLVAWYERRGYTRTGVFKSFPYGDDRFGEPKVDDLRMAVLEKHLT